MSPYGGFVEDNAVLRADEKVAQSLRCPCCGKQAITNWMRVPDRYQRRAGYYNLLHCVSCQHVWLGNAPTPDEMSFFYGPQYHRAVGGTGEISTARWKRQLGVIQQYK